MIGGHRGKENIRTFGFIGGKAWTRVGIGGLCDGPDAPRNYGVDPP